MAGIEKVNLQLYSPEKPRKAYINTGHHWLGVADSLPASSIKDSLPGVIKHLIETRDEVKDEIDNYDTWKNWAFSFFGEKKTKAELETFHKWFSDIITYLESKAKKVGA